MFTSVNGTIGTLRISATAMMPRRSSRRSSSCARRPSQRRNGLRPILRPSQNVMLAAISVPTAAQAKPSQGPSASTVAPISTSIGNDTMLPTANASSTMGTPQGLPRSAASAEVARSTKPEPPDGR